MRLAAVVARVVIESLHFSWKTRRLSLALTILLCLIAVALALAANVLAPVALYPFA